MTGFLFLYILDVYGYIWIFSEATERFIYVLNLYACLRNDFLQSSDENTDLFSELLTINLIKLEKVSQSVFDFYA